MPVTGRYSRADRRRLKIVVSPVRVWVSPFRSCCTAGCCRAARGDCLARGTSPGEPATLFHSRGRSRVGQGGRGCRFAWWKRQRSLLILGASTSSFVRVVATGGASLLLARRRANAVRRLAPAFVSPQAFRAATLAASGYGGARQSRRECRLGDQAEADRLAQLRSIAATMLSANWSGRERKG